MKQFTNFFLLSGILCFLLWTVLQRTAWLHLKVPGVTHSGSGVVYRWASGSRTASLTDSVNFAGHNMIYYTHLFLLYYFSTVWVCAYECRFPPRPERVLGPLEEQPVFPSPAIIFLNVPKILWEPVMVLNSPQLQQFSCTHTCSDSYQREFLFIYLFMTS